MSTNGCDEQLAEWLNGNSVHNLIRDECCPDFSCCAPDNAWPMEQRQLFVDAPDHLREQMLFMSLGSALALIGKRDDVYLAGDEGVALA